MRNRKPPLNDKSEPLQLPPVVPSLNRKRASDGDLITETREYELITPLFGGGVNPLEQDPITLIRGPSVRGHLRFWWRAVLAGRHGTIQALKRAEDRLWGTAGGAQGAGPSRVALAIEVGSQGDAFVVPPDHRGPVRISNPGRSPYAYAAFPLNKEPDATVRRGITFTIRLTYPVSDEAEVKAALWGWETFGGLGARTRRGFGALNVLSVNGTPRKLFPGVAVLQNLRSDIARLVVGAKWPYGVSHLSADPGHLRVTRVESDALQAWKYLINSLKQFRQQRRAGKGKRPGRSYWPEAEGIRRLTGQRLTNQVVEGARVTHASIPRF